MRGYERQITLWKGCYRCIYLHAFSFTGITTYFTDDNTVQLRTVQQKTAVVVRVKIVCDDVGEREKIGGRALERGAYQQKKRGEDRRRGENSREQQRRREIKIERKEAGREDREEKYK